MVLRNPIRRKHPLISDITQKKQGGRKMAFCSKCGTPIPDGTAMCPNCISSVVNDPPVQYPTGGLMAWSIITLLLCTIPGIVGLVKTTQINKCTSGAEQKKAISSAKTWNIVGSALGGLYVLITIIGMFAG